MERHLPDKQPPGLLRGLIARAAATLHVQIYRSSYALFLTTGANALLGLMFWVAAARLYSEDVVGLGAGGISALQLVACVGWVGLQFTLLRYVPAAGRWRRRLVVAVYAAGSAVALLVAIVFVLAFARVLEVPYVAGSTLQAVAFCACVVVWVVFSLQDAVLVGIRRAFLVPIENTAYGALKLVLLVVLSTIDDPWVLLGVWVASTAVLVAVVNGLLFWRLLDVDDERSRLPGRRRLASFSSGHTAVALTAWVPDFLVPLLVLSYLDQAANAYYYAAWTVGFSTRLLAMNLANALTAEGAYADNPISALVRSVVRLSLMVLLPAMVVLLVAAEPILSVFGANYADEAAPLLRLFAISLVPYTIATLVVAYDRVRERFGAALAITGVGTAATIALDIALIPAHGITGAGLGWLGGQLLAALAAVSLMARGGESHVAAVPDEGDASRIGS